MVIVLCVLIGCATVLASVWMLHPDPPAVPAAPPPVPPSILDGRLLHQVVVTMKNGSTFAGVLYVEDSGAVVLCQASKVLPNGSKVEADGEIILLRADIDFIQRP